MVSLSFSVVLAAVVAGVVADYPACYDDDMEPYVEQGCFTQPEGAYEAMIFRSEEDQQDMTIEKCARICKGNMFKYAGLIYYGVCYCAPSIESMTATDPESCNTPCSGDKCEWCGGDSAFSVYSDPTFPEPSEELSTNGCWTDQNLSGRALAYLQTDVVDMTAEGCRQTCFDRGFPYVGLEYGSECWCGVMLEGESHAAAAADEVCNMSCSNGDQCGGSGHMQLTTWESLLSEKPCSSAPVLDPSQAVPSKKRGLRRGGKGGIASA